MWRFPSAVTLVILCVVDNGLAQTEEPAEEHDIRLVGGSSLSEGRVEILHQGVWGTVCDDSWDESDATVVCRQLGFSGPAQTRSGGFFGEGSGQIWLDDVPCEGYESNLHQCIYNYGDYGNHNCDHSEDAGVVCSDQIRLVGGSNFSEGRVEILHEGIWGTVCDDSWDESDAMVVCRQLGFSGSAQAISRAFFGQGYNTIWLDEVGCIGHEPSLDQCSSHGWGNEDCDHTEDAGVVCEPCPSDSQFWCDNGICTYSSWECDGDNDCGDWSDEHEGCSQSQVRLVGGSSLSEGRVEILHHGLWGTVCDDSWDERDATVVCRQLGYQGYAEAKSSAFFGQGYGEIWLDNVECTGSELNLDQCPSNGWGYDDCSHSEDAGVVCFDACPPENFTCDNGVCIDSSSECDFNNDCGDESDEHEDCFSDQCIEDLDFKCDNGACIFAWWECDGDNDCGDLSDERYCLNSTCAPDRFLCDNGVCTYSSWECDDYNDCGDWSDEHDGCSQRTCSALYEYQCANGQCISTLWRCDGDDDCGDMSDESDCLTQTCTSVEYECYVPGFRRCISNYRVCDGYNDCADAADELDCKDYSCDEFTCLDGSCIPFDWVCDGEIDCQAFYLDEQYCYNYNYTYSFDYSWSTPSSDCSHTCPGGWCIPRNFLCDGYNDCGDYTDEMQSCTCESDELQCPNGICIPLSWKCDAYNDCGDWSDELECGSCNSNQFTCSDGSCIHTNSVCDHYNDCGDWKDEDGPSCDFQCLPGEYACGDGFCVSPYWVCNGHDDCADQSDEAAAACSRPRPCGGELTDVSGTISSPNFPSDYPNAANCTWIIQGLGRSTIELDFTHFALEEDPIWDSYCTDWVQIRDGELDLDGKVYCGYSIPPIFTSSGNNIWIQFVSNKIKTEQGFRANYRIVGSNPCESVTCSNGGTCIAGYTNFVCLCQDGYTGTYCETADDICQHVNCENGGTCETDGETIKCICQPGYEGLLCNIDVNECSSNPCQNGGRCVDMINKFTCKCSSGFEGLRCETKSNEVVASSTIILEEEFVPDLLDPTSTKYQEMAKEFETQMNEILLKSFEDTFDRCEVTGFRMGSVETYFDVYFTQPPDDIKDPSQIEEEMEMRLEFAITTATATGNLGGFSVRPESVDVSSVSSSRIGEELGCEHPGKIENGFVIPDRAERYNAGQKVDLVCRQDFMLVGDFEMFCTDKNVWSRSLPKCVEEAKDDGARLVGGQLPVIIAVAGVVVVVIIITIVIAVVCIKKKSHATNATRPESSVYFIPERTPENKGVNNTDPRRNTYFSQEASSAPINFAQAGALPGYRSTQSNRPPVPDQRPDQQPSHIYESTVEARQMREDPPDYIDLVNDNVIKPPHSKP